MWRGVVGLQYYYLFHAARADFCRLLGDKQAAKNAYRPALALTQLEPEKRLLQEKIDQQEKC